ncbi:hypothetical protein LOTGIDRAFT_159540 [Lottia gigantea]|uniref:Aminotransferase class I/classII large domain-containing protein n=1 Tax=Lottia gigantea TaxID=225164 RepID=V4AII6_LOTGI|nr:hypothetical protein LOTGIDRAFT_159540 [Lottia gigantea]ESO96802.1 hypothetical protein LOTGIDRAFT_159540 [Lottia gigantea]
MDQEKIPPSFKLERFFAKYEFSVKHLLCCSDAEAIQMTDLIARADEECKTMWNNLQLSYIESTGHPLLRAEICKLYPGITPEETQVVVPQEGIYIAMKAFMDTFVKDKPASRPHVIATFPGYQSLYGNLELDGADVTYWKPQYCEDKGWEFDIGQLKTLLKPDTKLLVVNFPHNPTGWQPNHQQWQQLIALCKERNIYLFSDEMYRLSNNTETEALPSACTLYNNAVTLCGLSKTFALPGLRIGWLSTKNKELMEKFQSFRDWLTICSSTPSEVLAIIALRNKDWVIEHTMNIIKTNLTILEQFLKKHSDSLEWHRPDASTVAFIKVKNKVLKQHSGSVAKWCDYLAHHAEVLLLPSTAYDYEDGFVRIGFGRRNMKEALKTLEKHI